ncbi:hypothetical protein KFK09_004837 [Dendrobium nobile]|uniref:Uncharacterized protein n=1 Tax=Dendrobium nobile TaxID=94219 RepID=A0A8T3BXG3_DENNO|nr:hypothetical protein KFK09_004837 [Dendrobium nobile]
MHKKSDKEGDKHQKISNSLIDCLAINPPREAIVVFWPLAMSIRTDRKKAAINNIEAAAEIDDISYCKGEQEREAAAEMLIWRRRHRYVVIYREEKSEKKNSRSGKGEYHYV